MSDPKPWLHVFPFIHGHAKGFSMGFGNPRGLCKLQPVEFLGSLGVSCCFLLRFPDKIHNTKTKLQFLPLAWILNIGLWILECPTLESFVVA